MRVPAERFVPESLRAYEDAPLPIAAGETISQPYVVALMVEALELDATARDAHVEVIHGDGTRGHPEEVPPSNRPRRGPWRFR